MKKWDYPWDYQWDYQWDYPWDYPILIYFTGKINMKNEHVHQPINMWFPLLVQRWINENSSEKWDYPIPIHFIRRFSQFSLRLFEPPFTQISPCSNDTFGVNGLNMSEHSEHPTFGLASDLLHLGPCQVEFVSLELQASWILLLERGNTLKIRWVFLTMWENVWEIV